MESGGLEARNYVYISSWGYSIYIRVEDGILDLFIESSGEPLGLNKPILQPGIHLAQC